MRANYKKLARMYKRNCNLLNEILSDGIASSRAEEDKIKSLERELDEWKTKYVQVLNMYIEMQDRIARKEEGNG